MAFLRCSVYAGFMQPDYSVISCRPCTGIRDGTFQEADNYLAMRSSGESGSEEDQAGR